MNIWPISISTTDWRTFVSACENILGRSPLARLHAERQETEGPVALLKAINSLNFGESIELDHAFISFLIECPYQVSVIMALRSDLCLTVSEKLDMDNVAMVASGTIGQWRDAFLHLCTFGRPVEVLELFNRLYRHFEQAKLTLLFNFRRTEQQNGYFTVEAG